MYYIILPFKSEAIFWRQFKSLESKELPKKSRPDKGGVGEQWDHNKAQRKVKLRLFVKREFNNYFLDFLFSYRKQLAILADLVKDLPLEFDFLFSQSQAEVISGKQEGIGPWGALWFTSQPTMT